MELKVWVEGIQRIVCGVTEATTCQDVVYALAHATGKTGRFTLIERWRNNERLLAPQEHPLKVVAKWGEYSGEVQLILERSGGWKSPPGSPSHPAKSPVSPPMTPGTQPTHHSGGGGGQAGLPLMKKPYPNSPPPPPLSSHQTHHHSVYPSQDNLNNDLVHPGNNKYLSELNNGSHAHPSHLLYNTKPNVVDNNTKETIVYNAHYRELLRLVNYQRERLSAQQAELTKYDAEIVFWEAKTREQKHQLEYMSKEVARIEATAQSNELKLKALSGIEEERELVQQQERTLKSELTLLRSKLANCETELLQCKNKIRLLSEEVEAEERVREEMMLLREVERLQIETEQAKRSTEMASHTAESLRSQVGALEVAISEKKKQVERLVEDMKEANLESLAISPAEEIKLLLEGPHKPGSSRRMIGSPRQLENAVPTSKNPHGVWV